MVSPTNCARIEGGAARIVCGTTCIGTDVDARVSASSNPTRGDGTARGKWHSDGSEDPPARSDRARTPVWASAQHRSRLAVRPERRWTRYVSASRASVRESPSSAMRCNAFSLSAAASRAIAASPARSTCGTR